MSAGLADTKSVPCERIMRTFGCHAFATVVFAAVVSLAASAASFAKAVNAGDASEASTSVTRVVTGSAGWDAQGVLHAHTKRLWNAMLLREFGMARMHDQAGTVIGYRLMDETLAEVRQFNQMVEDETSRRGSWWHRTKYGAALATFVASHVIPTGRTTKAVVKAVGMICKYGAAKVLRILKRWNNLNHADRAIATGIAAAIFGIDDLAVCREAAGI